MPRAKDIVIVKPLGQHGSGRGRKRNNPFGLTFLDDYKKYKAGTILIDPRQNQKSFMNTAIHEKLHNICPGWCESKISKTAGKITNLLWDLGYRKEL